MPASPAALGGGEGGEGGDSSPRLSSHLLSEDVESARGEGGGEGLRRLSGMRREEEKMFFALSRFDESEGC